VTLSNSAVLCADASTSVGMGQIAFEQAPQRLTSVLGSCVGVAMYHAPSKTGALGHIVLPKSDGRSGPPGKFADTAIPHMIELFKKAGVPAAKLVIKLAGGAHMFNRPGPMQIGDSNIAAVEEILKALGLRATARDLAGSSGRRVSLYCETGEFRVETNGGGAQTL
jgi:chemotaxis protein CheD